MQQLNGFFLVDKPSGPTSNRVLQDVRRGIIGASRSKTLKFGHAGTLDSFASGLLIVLVGRLTRLTPWFMGQTKEYFATIQFGAETDTLDPLGKVVAEAESPSAGELERALDRFRGNIEQVPPAYSAVHVGGVRSYEKAMRGEPSALAPRTVRIETLELCSFENGQAMLDIRCSSGTYIRALARDIALECGSRAHLASLRRIGIGAFNISDAIAPEVCVRERARNFSAEVAHSIGLGSATLVKEYLVPFSHGSELPEAAMWNLWKRDGAHGISPVAVFAESGEFIGIVKSLRGSYQPMMVAMEELGL